MNYIKRDAIKENFIIILIIAGLFLMDRLWYLDIKVSLGGRGKPFSEIISGLSLLLFSICIFKTKITKILKNKFFSVVVLVFVSVALSYTLGSCVYFGQPLERIFRVVFWFSGLLAYFFFVNQKNNDLVAKKIFPKMIFYGVFASVLVILLTLIPELSRFFEEDATSERFGMVRYGRIATDSILMSFCYFMSCILFYKNKSKEKSRYIILFLITYAIFFVEMSRQKMISIIVCVLFSITFLLCLKKISAKKLINIGYKFIFAATFGVIIFSSKLELFTTNLLDSLNTNVNSAESLSLALRLEGINYYYKLLLKTKFIGIGWISHALDMPENEITYATNIYNYKLVDLGALGTFFQYGFIGLAVILLFLYINGKMLKSIFEVGNVQDRVFSFTIGCFLFIKVVSMNYLFYWHDFTFYYAILMFIVEQKYKEVYLAQIVRV